MKWKKWIDPPEDEESGGWPIPSWWYGLYLWLVRSYAFQWQHVPKARLGAKWRLEIERGDQWVGRFSKTHLAGGVRFRDEYFILIPCIPLHISWRESRHGPRGLWPKTNKKGIERWRVD